MKCKNIECENETDGSKKYCSLKCRNIYVNKYLRNYDKVSKTFKEKRRIEEDEYLKAPRICKACDEAIPFESRLNNEYYCSKSCSVKITNKERKGLKLNMSSNGRESLRKSIYENILKRPYEEYKEKFCIGCNSSLKRNKFYCSNECRKIKRRESMDEFIKYKADASFNFNLKDYPNEFDFTLIEKHGWYKPSNRGNNLDGVSRDHMYSIAEGFKNGVDAKLISHPANCRLIKHSENISKNKSSIITIEELLKRIELWKIVYTI